MFKTSSIDSINGIPAVFKEVLIKRVMKDTAKAKRIKKATDVKGLLMELFLLEGNKYESRIAPDCDAHSSTIACGALIVLAGGAYFPCIKAILESGRIVEYGLTGLEYSTLRSRVEKVWESEKALDVDEFYKYASNFLKHGTKTN